MLEAVVLGVALLAAQHEDAPWYQLYDRGVSAVQRGHHDEARPLLEAALARRSEEGLRVRTTGVYFVDYMPTLYLALACQAAGDLPAAHRYLKATEASGVAAQSEVGRPLLDAVRILLVEPRVDEAPAPPPAPPQPRSFRLFPPQPPSLSEAEFRRLREQVAARCGVPADLPPGKAPWYFHYELGIALARQGDPQRAVEALIVSTDHKPRSQRQARMYGMWFIDYIPFYWIARQHALLGNWECVVDALDASQRSGEVSERDQEFAEFRALVEESRKHAFP